MSIYIDPPKYSPRRKHVIKLLDKSLDMLGRRLIHSRADSVMISLAELNSMKNAMIQARLQLDSDHHKLEEKEVDETN